jgi:hypothetical protein
MARNGVKFIKYDIVQNSLVLDLKFSSPLGM